MTQRTSIVLRSLLWITLGGWLGAIALFSAVVAPTAFQVLPSSELAGQMVGRVFTPLQLYGVAAGLGLGALAGLLGRGRALLALPLVLSGLCLLSHFGVSARMAELRPLAYGPGADPAAHRQFVALHRISVGLLLATGVGAAVLTVGHVRAEERGAI